MIDRNDYRFTPSEWRILTVLCNGALPKSGATVDEVLKAARETEVYGHQALGSLAQRGHVWAHMRDTQQRAVPPFYTVSPLGHRIWSDLKYD